MFLNSELPYQGEAILRNGTTTTTASIPFALGLSSTGPATFTVSNAATVPLAIYPNASQSADTFQIFTRDGISNLVRAVADPVNSTTRGYVNIGGLPTLIVSPSTSADKLVIANIADSTIVGGNANNRAIFSTAEFTGISAYPGNFNAGSFTAGTQASSTGNLTAPDIVSGGLIGGLYRVRHNGTGTVTGASAIMTGIATGTSSGPITDATAVHILAATINGMASTNIHAIRIRTQVDMNTSVTANWYGIRIGEQLGTANIYPIMLEGANKLFWRDSSTYMYSPSAGNLTINGALNVVGTTTLATGLTGILKATSGVVATATSSDLITAIGNADDDEVTKGVSTYTNNDFNVVSGLVSINTGGTFYWTGAHTWGHSAMMNYDKGWGITGLANDMPAGLIGDFGSNELMQFGINVYQAETSFSDFGYLVYTGRQGGIFRFDTRNGYPIFTVGFQDNQDNLSGGSGVQYAAIQISGSQGRLGLGTGHAFDTDTYYGTVDISPKTNEVALYVRQEPGAGADITQWVNTGGAVRAYIDKSWNFSTAGDIFAGGSVTATTSVLGAKGYFNGNATNTLLVEQNGVKNNVFVVDTTNAAVGINQSATTTSVLGITDSQATRVTGRSGINFAQTFSWATGAAVNTGNNGILYSLNDSHIADSGTVDTIRGVNLSLSRGIGFASLANINNFSSHQVSLTDSGTYNRTAGNQTANIVAMVNGSGSFSPVYNDSTGTRTLTYNAAGFQYTGSFFPTKIAGAGITGNLRGFYVSSLTGNTTSGITSNVTGVEVASVNTGATLTGVKVTSISGGTTSIGAHIASLSGGTTSYGVKIDTVSSSTTAIGLGITAVPTTATNKFQIALDSTGAGSGIYFNTPTAAGTEYIRAASSGILESSYATTYRIKEPTTSTYPLQINSTGQVAISTNNSPATYLKLYVQDKSTDPASGLKYAFSAVQEVQPTGTWTGSNQGGFSGGVRYVATQDFNNGSTLIGLEGSAAVYVGAGKTIQSANAVFANSTARGNGGGGGTVSTFSLYGIYMTVDQATISNLYDYRTYDAPLSNGGAVTNQYGYYAAEMTAATNNYEIFLATAGGIFFRDGNQYIDSSAANTLRHAANTTQLFNIGGTTEITLTGTQLDLMSANTDRVNFIGGSDGGAATTAGGAPTFTDYYGGNTKAMGDPTGWLNVKINGTARKIPYY